MPALPLTALHALALHPPFAARVRMAWTYVARQVLSEDPGTPGSPLRGSLARAVLNPADLSLSASTGLTPVIVTCDTIITAASTAGSEEPSALSAAISDAVLIASVEKAWNITAGVPRELLLSSA
ncbi:hypothetical protein ACWD4V_00790 [Streptomyces tsukubensis]